MSYSSAFAAELSVGAWRIVVPVKGRLAPKLLAPVFQTKSEAETWLASAEGQALVHDAQKRLPTRGLATARS